MRYNIAVQSSERNTALLPEGVLSLKLIEDGIRLTDQTGETADFVYVPESDTVILSQ